MDTLNVVVGLGMAAAGILISLYLGRISLRQYVERTSTEEFLSIRRAMREHSGELRRTAAAAQTGMLSALAPAIAKPGWILAEPVDVDKVQFTLVPDDGWRPGTDDRSTFSRYLPATITGRRFERYHEAVAALDRPANWFNGVCYRLHGVDTVSGSHGLTIRVGTARYWDGFDTTEALAHEAAYVYRRSHGRRIDGRYRRRLADPYRLSSRCCTMGFVTLTVRRSSRGSTFYLHRRDDRVATGSNMTNLIPAGEFQPSDDSPFAVEQDLYLWRAMMREYAEEMLGADEARIRRGAPIDYERQEPYKQLHLGRREGAIRPYFLGIGFEPLTWKAQMYTVCVFDARTFDRVFGAMISENLEGVLELPTLYRSKGRPLVGWPFDQGTVERYLADVRLGPSARVSLGLALRYRSSLGI